MAGFKVITEALPFRDPGGLVQIVSWWPKTGNQTDWSAPLAEAEQHRKINRYQRVIVTENEYAEIVGVWGGWSLNNQASDMFAGGFLDNNFGLILLALFAHGLPFRRWPRFLFTMSSTRP